MSLSSMSGIFPKKSMTGDLWSENWCMVEEKFDIAKWYQLVEKFDIVLLEFAKTSIFIITIRGDSKNTR